MRKPSKSFTTRHSNRNGNAGRPYYKCQPCNKFLCFADSRGNNPGNPPCDCGVSSKTQVAGKEKKVPRGVHYVCRLGKCDFYKPCVENGKQVAVESDDLVHRLAMLSIL
ncbi:hypothetical protein C8A03DRAFT_19562 [Achaetomium macrosporum]|uniref:GRF-like zinc ribbon domain-containing protein n=1 Tax=Achaetomium macrosporum TaxID=79813 RepID=A0AAN7H6T5_9PEZI|nr:hypothetical protein C8A03DRAFT_19562 [Achaetomium macrosporum]